MSEPFFWILAVGAGAIVLLGVAEVSLRRLSRGTYFVWSPYRRILFHHDPAVLPGADRVARISINAHGERGQPIPHSWKGIFRILVMGGSNAECLALDQPHSWPEVMRAQLESPKILNALGAHALHVGNIARSLLSIDAQRRILQAVKPRYPRLDLIILMVGASNVIRWLEHGAPAADGASVQPSDKIFSSYPGMHHRGWRRLALLRMGADLYHRYCRREIVLDTYTRRVAARRLRRERATVFQSDVPDAAAMLAQCERDLGQLLELAKSCANRVILVRHVWLDREVPPGEQATLWMGSLGAPADSAAPGAYVSWDVMRALMMRVNEVCVQAAASAGVEQVDVKGLIPMDFEHYIDGFHLGMKGARIVGQAVAAQVAQGNPAGL
jgi:lysophospholipase L1-like esterase